MAIVDRQVRTSVAVLRAEAHLEGTPFRTDPTLDEVGGRSAERHSVARQALAIGCPDSSFAELTWTTWSWASRRSEVANPVLSSLNTARVGAAGGADDGAGDGVEGVALSQPANAGRTVRSSVIVLVAFHMMACPLGRPICFSVRQASAETFPFTSYNEGTAASNSGRESLGIWRDYRTSRICSRRFWWWGSRA